MSFETSYNCQSMTDWINLKGIRPSNNINMNKCRNLHIHTCPYTLWKENIGSFQTPWGILKFDHLFSMFDKVLKKKIIFSTSVQ